MTKLSVELVQSKLLEDYELKKVRQIKGPSGFTENPRNAGAPEKPRWKSVRSKTTASHEVKKPSSPELKLTKIQQVELPGKRSRTTEAGGSAKDQSGLPQAERADKIAYKMQVPSMRKSENQKSPKVPRVGQGPKPNQTTKLKSVGNAIKRTDDDNPSKTWIPQAKSAREYEAKMPGGRKNLRSASDDVPTVKAPKAKNLGGTTSPKGGERKARLDPKGRDSHHVKQVRGPSGFVSDPSDAMKRKQTFKKDTGGSQSVVESGVYVKLGKRTKATFEVVSTKVLNKLRESYKKMGYNITVERFKPTWMQDREFVSKMFERVDAKWNLVPKFHTSCRKDAFKRFYSLCKNRYNDLYERHDDFINTVREAFKKVEKLAEKNYLTRLQIYECHARVKKNGQIADISIMTEATNHDMALRQIRGKIAENYGLSTPILHVFVDGRKYRAKQIKEWTPRS